MTQNRDDGRTKVGKRIGVGCYNNFFLTNTRRETNREERVSMTNSSKLVESGEIRKEKVRRETRPQSPYLPV